MRIDTANKILGLRVNEWVSALIFLGAAGFLAVDAWRHRNDEPPAAESDDGVEPVAGGEPPDDEPDERGGARRAGRAARQLVSGSTVVLLAWAACPTGSRPTTSPMWPCSPASPSPLTSWSATPASSPACSTTSPTSTPSTLDGVEPMTQPYPLVNVLREDIVGDCLDRDEVLSQAPAAEDGRFRVPPILGEAP